MSRSREAPPSAPSTRPAVAERLQTLGGAVSDDFAANKRLLSYAEYLELVAQAPRVHLRGAAQYLCDMFEHYGTEQVSSPVGTQQRFRLFDAPWDQGRGRLVGQESLQNDLYRVLRNFVRQGRIDRFILLHGPNGSAKSTAIDLLARGMEHYSGRDEGALYCFSWVFPTQAIERSGIGFGDAAERGAPRLQSYAHLDDTAIDARVHCDVHDHPLLLIPAARRAELLDSLGAGATAPAAALGDYLGKGDLCFKCKQVYEALLSAYEGDFLRVLRHVQVQRLYVSRRYRVGTARVEPQMAVDATLRQVTGDRSLAALPSALQSVALYEADGELVRANRGLIDFADLFKRPLEAFKYLLAAVESGQVALPQVTLFVDLVFIGSANENHLNALMESPEWMSFKARFELVRVPYLLDFRREQQIYELQLREAQPGKPAAPHVTEAAALWAVLTRLRRPDPKHFEEPLRTLVAKLSPRDKALLYADGTTPAGLSEEQAKTLRAHVEALWREGSSALYYEGRTGASAREVKTALMNAAQAAQHGCLSPEAVLQQLEQLAGETAVYEFLRQEPQGEGYANHRAFAEVVRQWCLDRLDEELHAATGLVEESRHGELLARYLTQVTHHVRKEKLTNPVTGAQEDPDPRLLAEVERTLGVEGNVDDFRRGLISRIGAWALDHPDRRPEYAEVFPQHLTRLRERYYEQQHQRVRRLLGQALQLLAGEQAGLSPDDLGRARALLERLERQFGYAEPCAREALMRLARSRYAD
ncbi:MAG: serine protein kinase PrkA [Proteobacteria bacterium]|nr:serine protein kinase PrkA [Pseudomonadota bacterium]